MASEEYDEEQEVGSEEELDEEYYEEEGHEDQGFELPTYEDYLRAQKITFKDITEHLTGPIISIIVHVILIGLLGTIIVFKREEEKPEIEVEVQEVDIKEIEEIPEPPEPPEEVTEVVDVQIENPTVTSEVETDVPVDDVAVEDVNVSVDIPDLTAKPSNSALKLNAVYSLRSGGARKKALKTYGGSGATERAVEKGLKWLASVQNKDGSWGVLDQNKSVFTALALLAFLGHGETPMSAKYGQTVTKSIKYLVSVVENMKARRQKYLAGPYTHPIVAFTIAEAWALTGIPKLREAMYDTMGIVIDGINRNGTYASHPAYDNKIYTRYPSTFRRDEYTGRYPRPRPKKEEWVREDLAYSTWNYQTLKSGYSAGCDMEGLNKTMLKAIKGLKKKINAGKLGGEKSDYTLTTIGCLALGLMGEGNTRESKKCKKFIKEFNPEQIKNCSWKYKKSIHDKYKNAFTWAMYTWYYQTMVIFQLEKGKGPMWYKWNKAFSKEFVKEQESDGRWYAPAQKYGKGHIDAKKLGAEWDQTLQFKDKLDIAIYSTCFACLCLEVYYRYLPTTKLMLKQTRTKKKATIEDEDLDIDIQ